MTKHPLKPGDKRRSRVHDKPNHPLHIWSILKNCIGKDLSKIPMPVNDKIVFKVVLMIFNIITCLQVNFSEPLSMLQRITEDFEYSSILDTAAQCKDSFEQMAYVAAFTISSYSTTVNRTSKPFNPLLGETYECDRMSDLGWKAFNEQVITVLIDHYYTYLYYIKLNIKYLGFTSSTNFSTILYG